MVPLFSHYCRWVASDNLGTVLTGMNGNDPSVRKRWPVEWLDASLSDLTPKGNTRL
jgi:hypothetical protein